MQVLEEIDKNCFKELLPCLLLKKIAMPLKGYQILEFYYAIGGSFKTGS
jgi:hypothetical protein